ATSEEGPLSHPLRASQLAVLLHDAGFEPVVVPGAEEVPLGAPSVARGTNESGDCEEPGGWVWTLMWDLTLGLVPQYRCIQTGYRCGLEPAPTAPVQQIATRARVPMILGWFAIPLGRSKGYTSGWLLPPMEYFSDRPQTAVRAAVLDALAPR